LYKVFASDYKHQLARLDSFERETATHESNLIQLVQIGEQIAALGDLSFDYTYCGQLEATLKHQDSLVAAFATYEANSGSLQRDSGQERDFGGTHSQAGRL
jgi:hypothetical protein